MRNKIINTIEKEKIITIVRGVEKDRLIPFAEAVYAGGIRLIEITYSANGDISDEEMDSFYRTLEKISNRIVDSETVFFSDDK